MRNWFAISLVFIFITMFSSCIRKVTIIVDELPSNTPKSASIFVSGNFNYWDPSDRSLLLKNRIGNKLMVDLPYGWGHGLFKFTRGDWKTVERDACGHEMKNRFVNYSDEDTIHIRIESWADLGPTNCEQTVLMVLVPKETPKNAPIFVASNLNNWNPSDSEYAIEPDEEGRYLARVDNLESDVDFKFTRGGWETEELDADRMSIPNRKFQFGKQDTVKVTIEAWKDILPGMESKMITFIVKAPNSTRETDKVFITGTFNNWNPSAEKYQLRRLTNNHYTISFIKPRGKMEYKFTRGNWSSEEVNEYHFTIDNRQFTTSSDSVEVKVLGWKDRNPESIR